MSQVTAQVLVGRSWMNPTHVLLLWEGSASAWVLHPLGQGGEAARWGRQGEPSLEDALLMAALLVLEDLELLGAFRTLVPGADPGNLDPGSLAPAALRELRDALRQLRWGNARLAVSIFSGCSLRDPAATLARHGVGHDLCLAVADPRHPGARTE